MKILVTGSSGHLGEAIIRVLQSKNLDYVSVDIKASPFTTHLGSIADRSFVRSCMQGVDIVLHTATLHKPHVATHSKQDFIDTNISGTLNLLEEAKSQGVSAFIFTSTTSAFGDALVTKGGEPAVWVTEKTVPIPKNIYGTTKLAAEDLCHLFYRNHQLPCLILKTSRFFPEDDDKKSMRDAYDGDNIKVNEFLHRRVDVEDAVQAHLLAMEKASDIGFGKYIITATPPFSKNDLMELKQNAPAVVERLFPDYVSIFQARGWKMFPKIGRVYVNEKARRELGWAPKFDFHHILDRLAQSKDYRSTLAIAIGAKGYHAQKFSDGPYPVEE